MELFIAFGSSMMYATTSDRRPPSNEISIQSVYSIQCIIKHYYYSM